uniref:Uncharacterized protein n=1 Tax=Amphimedon queenslandica TaxID=400682 RepID=A0A1X7VWB1_AMPQE
MWAEERREQALMRGAKPPYPKKAKVSSPGLGLRQSRAEERMLQIGINPLDFLFTSVVDFGFFRNGLLKKREYALFVIN